MITKYAPEPGDFTAIWHTSSDPCPGCQELDGEQWNNPYDIPTAEETCFSMNGVGKGDGECACTIEIDDPRYGGDDIDAVAFDPEEFQASEKIAIPIDRLGWAQKTVSGESNKPFGDRVEFYKKCIENGEPIKPIRVEPLEHGGYVIKDGQHRALAAKELGYENIWAIVDKSARITSTVASWPLEKLVTAKVYLAEQLAKIVGYHREWLMPEESEDHYDIDKSVYADNFDFALGHVVKLPEAETIVEGKAWHTHVRIFNGKPFSTMCFKDDKDSSVAGVNR